MAEITFARIETIALSAIRSIFTDDQMSFPAPGELIWWEIWIRQGHVEAFDTVLDRLEIPASPQRLVFPDREVRLVFGDEITIARLFLNSNSICAEVRIFQGPVTWFADPGQPNPAACPCGPSPPPVAPGEPA